MRESNIENKLKNKVNQKGGLAIKLVSPGNAGMPDRLLLFPEARVAFVELKAPSKSLRALQVKRKQQIELLGFRVYTLDSYEAIDGLIQEIRT